MFFQTSDHEAKFPTKATDGSAGYDLYAHEKGLIKVGQRRLIKTGVGVVLPLGKYGRIAPRSSLAFKFGIDVFAGVIDSDYRQEIGVILYNSGTVDYAYEKGDRIAQIIVESCYEIPSMGTKEDAMKLPDWNTQRTGGFGSTGQ